MRLLYLDMYCRMYSKERAVQLHNLNYDRSVILSLYMTDRWP